MPVVHLKHVTNYKYASPVQLGLHRIMVRPRESYDQHLLEAKLDISPQPRELRWLQDVFGNAVALATFEGRTRELHIESRVRVRHSPHTADDVRVEAYAGTYPFTYASEDMPDLLRSIERGYADYERVVDEWARTFIVRDGATDTFAMLRRMTLLIHREFTYLARYEKGTQSPMETLRRRQGTCRDFAVLMIEAARSLGLAARFVSGYLYDPGRVEPIVGGGNTHAWVRIFLPGSGWIEFDPTNGIVGNSGLIRVALARDPHQAVPVSGTWRGFPSDNLGMHVSVDVHCEDSEAQNSDSIAVSSTAQRSLPARPPANVAVSAPQPAPPVQQTPKRASRGTEDK